MVLTGAVFFNWVVLPLIIFFARVIDVSIGTLRLILLSKGYVKIVPLMGFLEMMVWLIAVRNIILNLANPVCYVAFAAGFATGNYVGIKIEQKLAMGHVGLRVITGKEGSDIFRVMIEHGFGVTNVPAIGARGDVNVLFTILQRKDLDKAIGIINEHNPNAFYTIEDIRQVNQGILNSWQFKK